MLDSPDPVKTNAQVRITKEEDALVSAENEAPLAGEFVFLVGVCALIKSRFTKGRAL
jgi:hypothetical protein